MIFLFKKYQKKYHITLKIFKTCFDCTFLILSFIMSLFLFHGIVGIGIGTIIIALFNGTFISFFKNFLDIPSHLPYFPPAGSGTC